ncbi:Vacuolar transporter chaperone 3 [Wickerhamomyces ciferrii]|uniref:Vacuolar transporter chaperone 3 n=1 Tax=Wickerhamomyces ciferrii (strain ATCC 14091 / BCRC 22168 / CBS 111 / JCM 3599 / NBRC 0793 / NRRL Y-1031 F-60-10) TaxID=1206466 RepID=K0KYR7_WICCF|nr:Vacuolar transporter chaperone 3 [Wickerhamomyces ciferrii]CCH46223.1 Vacuolar transporter chaperone 3 [Wickerhamomyces ciferrii]
MKFGSQLQKKSVPEWKSYNIDYNHLKFKIRIITDQSQKINNTLLIKDLYNEFIEQIDMVNLFLNSKIGEIKRRIIYIENTIEHQIKPHNHEEFEIDIENYLYKISNDLQKISRFIMIQKTAIRKLLKKFTKYSNDQGELNLKINKYLISNSNSFIHLDLTGLYLELALIYDLIRADLQASISPSNSPTPTIPNNNNRRRSSYIDPSTILNKNEYFQYESIKEGNYLEKFLVHYDNLQELKLFLLANFYFVNQNVSETRQTIELKKQTSKLSLREIINKHSNSQEDLTLQDTNNSIYVNNQDNLVDDSTLLGLILDNEHTHHNNSNNIIEPGLIITNLNHTKRTILLSAIGGLRKISCVLMNDYEFLGNLLKSCLEGQSYKDFYSQNSLKLQSLSSLEKISIEWIYSKNVKPIYKFKFNETNFTNLNAMKTIYKDSNFKCWINLKSNIKINDLDLDQMEWTGENEFNSINFPYALLEVRWNLPNISHTVLDKLFDNHLIYNIDQSFNLLNYYKFTQNKLSMNPCPKWCEIFQKNLDIRKLPPRLTKIKNKSKLNLKQEEINGGAGSVSGESTVQFRYWNEFDNGSDFEQDDGGFLIDINDDSSQWGKNSIDWFLQKSLNLYNFLESFQSKEQIRPKGRLINDLEQGYGSLDSDLESINDDGYKNLQTSFFLSSLSLISSIISLLLTSISIGILTSIYNSKYEVEISTLVMGILIITMILSLFLGVLSICLIMNCDDRPGFNFWFSWIVFISVTIFIIGSIGSIFGI